MNQAMPLALVHVIQPLVSWHHCLSLPIIPSYVNQTAKCRVSFTAFEDHQIEGYHCNDKQFCHFLMYNLTFAHYSRVQPGSPGRGTTSVINLQ